MTSNAHLLHVAQKARRARGTDHEPPDFDRIYRDHVAFVWRALRALGVPEDAVEDATHDVFVVVHRRLADWDGQCRMTTWLFGIARGVSRNTLRGRHRAERKLAAVRLGRAEDSGRFAAPDRVTQHREAAALLAAFLDGLDPRKRLVFELCEVEGLSPAEAARCLDENPNTIATRLRRARQAFDAFVRAMHAEEEA